MRRYAFSALLLLILPALVLVVMSQAPSADVSNGTGQQLPDPASLNAVAAGTPIVLSVQRTTTETTTYQVTNMDDMDPASVSHEFYNGGYPAGNKTGSFQESIPPSETVKYNVDNLGPVVPQGFDGDVVISSTRSITAMVVPPPGDTYLPSVHRDPTPTPTPTPTAVPEPTGTGIFHQISETYGSSGNTVFWLYFWGPEGRDHPADGSIFVKICISKGDNAGTCEWSANGHNGNTGELIVWLSRSKSWESKGTVTLYRSEDGTRPDEDADPISRAFIFDTRDTGSEVGMEFQECTTASTDWECDPSQWSLRSSVDTIEGKTLSPQAFDKWIDSRRQQ